MLHFEPHEPLRIADGQPMTAELLQEYINAHRDEVDRHLLQLDKAYRTDYDIFHQPQKPKYKPDNHIAVNFARYITDTLNGFFIGIPVKTSSDDDQVSSYVNLLDNYNGQDDKNAELAKLSEIFGYAYEMYYVDDNGQIATAELSPMHAFMIYDESIVERPKYFVRTYKDVNGVVHGSISDDINVQYFILNPSLTFSTEEPTPHGFNGVPAVEYKFNAYRQGVFEPVMPMINAYNKAFSEKANDVEYYSDAYLAILGARLDNDDLQHIRDNRIINFDGVDDGNLKVEFLSKPDADSSQEHLIDRLERLIYQISMVANINDENFGSSSGIALKYKLQSMSNLAKTQERKFTAGLYDRYKLIFSNPLAPVSETDFAKLEFKFTRNYPANELEESEIASNLAGIVSKDTQLKTLSIVDDVQAEKERLAEDKADDLNESANLWTASTDRA